jgi:hypothetical protein
MSHIPSSGGVHIHLKSGKGGSWWYHDPAPGWQGNTFIQAQPYDAYASLVCVPGAIQKQDDGSYKFWTSITNHGPNETHFNIQVSED